MAGISSGDFGDESYGPGFSSADDARKFAPREKIIYVPCIQPNPTESHKQDYLATVDVDPQSPTYSKVIHRLKMQNLGDELHHSGWNACSSCHCDPSRKRDTLVFPCLKSDTIYFVDTKTDPRAPRLRADKTVTSSELHNLNVGAPHTSHCLGSGEIMISTMGDKDGNAQGNFILLDSREFNVKGLWNKEPVGFGYDFWYQPHHNVMVSSGWGAPNAFRQGFNPADVAAGLYGHSIYVWDWKNHKLQQTIDLGSDGYLPLETRFLHNPLSKHGYVGCALTGNIFHFYQKECGKWAADKAISIAALDVTNWLLPQMPALITDILISLDDRFLYVSNWSHGDLRQYDITDRAHPKLVGQIFLGGSICSDGNVEITGPAPILQRPPPRIIKGVRVEGATQMIQLSLDGERLYITTSLFRSWDKQFYPELINKGAVMMQVDVDIHHGGLKINEDFLINFGEEPDGPVLAHEMRYPGGDSTSDIWICK